MDDKALVELAKKARANAYAPYSGFSVGAAVLAADGRVFSGCNIENASYGLTNCAERTAIFSAVAAGARELAALAVVADGELPCSPCHRRVRRRAHHPRQPRGQDANRDEGRAAALRLYACRKPPAVRLTAGGFHRDLQPPLQDSAHAALPAAGCDHPAHGLQRNEPLRRTIRPNAKRGGCTKRTCSRPVFFWQDAPTQ